MVFSIAGPFFMSIKLFSSSDNTCLKLQKDLHKTKDNKKNKNNLNLT